MLKISDSAKFVLFAVAAACHVSPAKAEAIIGDGYKCYPDQRFGHPYPGEIKTVFDLIFKSCLELCNQTPGCTAFNWVHWNKKPEYTYSCTLYKAGKKTLSKALYGWPGSYGIACTKLPLGKYPKPGDVPQTYQEIPQPGPRTYQEIPPTIPHDQNRPGPQPGPPPGGRR